jgi:putative ABC transport system permease protein
MNSFFGILRVALTDLRGGLGRFVVLIACLALGVGTIAVVGSVDASVQAALNVDARNMLGGDLQAQLTYRRATEDERALFASLGRVSEVVDFFGRASGEDRSAFVTIRAADEQYPLLDRIITSVPGPLPSLLDDRNGVKGVLASQALLDALLAKVGDTITIGNGDFQVRGTFQGLPDQASQDIIVGYPVLMSMAGIDATGIVKPGTLARYSYKIVFGRDSNFETAVAAIRQRFPNAGYEFTAPHQATQQLARYFDLFRRFLTIVALSALLVGGIGVANGVTAYVGTRNREIATMKALGATRGRIVVHYLVQTFVLVGIGILLGILIGMTLSLFALPILGPYVGLRLTPVIEWSSLLSAAGFGLLVGFTFAYVPLQRASELQPALLFRSAGSEAAPMSIKSLRRPEVILPLLAALAALFALAANVAGRADLVFWFALGAGLAFALLGAASRLLRWVVRHMPPLPDAKTRNALQAIGRPGAPAATIVLSLGLGLSLLILLVTISGSMRHQLDRSFTVDAPDFIYMDLFEDEAAELQAFSHSDPRIKSFRSEPVLRSSTLMVNGQKPPALEDIPRDISMFFGGDQPVSTGAELPTGNTLVGGAWWKPDYTGPALVSVAQQVQQAYGIKLGDTLTFNIFGGDLTATVASIRSFDWQRVRVNFPFVLSPHALDDFPLSYFAFIEVLPGQQVAVQRTLMEQYPQLVFIPIDEALGSIIKVIDSISSAVSVVGAIAISSGVLALAGALASGRRQREAEAIVEKVLGATRSDILIGYLIEYGLVGSVASLMATAIGLGGAWIVSSLFTDMRFEIDPGVLAIAIGSAFLVVFGVGAATTWGALSVRPGRALRDE